MQNKSHTYTLVMLLCSSICLARVKIDKAIAISNKNVNRSISMASQLPIAQKKFEGFIECGKQIGKEMSLIGTPAFKCIQQFMHPDAGDGNIVSYLIWLQQDSQVSTLGACPEREMKRIYFIASTIAKEALHKQQ